MFSPLRNRFGIPGVISVIALVFAMLGGAYAASSSDNGKATASAKAKKGPRGPKGATGPAGPAGAQGPAGPAGAKGDAGAAGSNGTNGSNGATGAAGANGKSVLNGTGAPSAGTGTVGDFYINAVNNEIYGPKTAGGWGAPTALQGPAGPQGNPWTAGGTLPVGSTETGVLSLNTTQAASNPIGPFFVSTIAIPFSIPLSGALTEPAIHFSTDAGFDTTCTGSAANPTAPSGQLCVYLDGPMLNMTYFGTGGSYTTGVLLAFSVTGSASGIAAWAVTG